MVKILNLLLTILLLSPMAEAADEYGRGLHPFRDADVGEVKIVVSDIGETQDIMAVYILCYDKRARPNTVKPKWEELSKTAICLYRPRPDTYNNVTKTLSLHFSRFQIKPGGGPSECAIHENTTVDMRLWCHAWQPPN